MEPISQNFSEAYYCKVNLSDSYNNYCYLKTRFTMVTDNVTDYPVGITDSHCPLWKYNTEWVYSPAQELTVLLISTPVSIMGSFLNFLVILTLLKTPKLRKEIISPFIVSLATTDYIYSTLTIPMFIARFSLRGWPFGEALCRMFPLFDTTLVACTLWNLLSMTVIRFVCVYYPMEVRQQTFKSRCTLLIPLAWLAAYLPGLIPLSGLYNINGMECRAFYCTRINLISEGILQKNILNILVPITMILTVFPLIVLNSATYLRLWKYTQRILEQLTDMTDEQKDIFVKKEKKVGKTITMVTLVFFVTYCPMITLYTIYPNARLTNTWEITFCWHLLTLGVVINPLLYMYKHKNYREATKVMLKRTQDYVSSILSAQESNNMKYLMKILLSVKYNEVKSVR